MRTRTAARESCSEYRRARQSETASPRGPAKARDILTVYGIDPRVLEWFEAAYHGSCRCGKPGIYCEQKKAPGSSTARTIGRISTRGTSAVSPVSRSNMLAGDGFGTVRLILESEEAKKGAGPPKGHDDSA